MGCYHPRYLEPYLSARDIAEWMEYYNCEPWGEDRADMRSAMQAMVVANTAPFKAKGAKTFTIDDFLLKFDGDTKRSPQHDAPRHGKTPDEMLAKAKALTRRMGGKVPE